MILNFTFAISAIFLLMFLNFGGFGPSPTSFNLILTILFLVLWLLFGIFRGRERKRSYLIFVIIFWTVALGTCFIAMNLGPNPLNMVSFAIITPLTGLRLFEFMKSDNLFYGSMILPLVVTCIGYFVGLKKLAKNADDK